MNAHDENTSKAIVAIGYSRNTFAELVHIVNPSQEDRWALILEIEQWSLEFEIPNKQFFLELLQFLERNKGRTDITIAQAGEYPNMPEGTEIIREVDTLCYKIDEDIDFQFSKCGEYKDRFRLTLVTGRTVTHYNFINQAPEDLIEALRQLALDVDSGRVKS